LFDHGGASVSYNLFFDRFVKDAVLLWYPTAGGPNGKRRFVVLKRWSYLSFLHDDAFAFPHVARVAAGPFTLYLPVT